MDLIIKGDVQDEYAKPLRGVTVRSFDKDLRSEEFLGEARTNARGRYQIKYSPDHLTRAEKRSADLVVRAFDENGQVLAESPVLFNAPPAATIDLIISSSSGPQLSEFERLVLQITPLLDGVPLAELTEEDGAFLAQETGVAREAILLLGRSAQLAEQLGLPVEVIYALARAGLPLELDALLNQGVATVRSALEKAITESIIPGAVQDALDTILERWERLPVEQGLEQVFAFFGRVTNSETGTPLAGLLVRAFDLEAFPNKELGQDSTDAQGRLSVGYTAPVPPPAARRLGLHIVDRDGNEVHQVDVDATPGSTQLVGIPVPAPKKPDPSASLTTIDSMVELPAPLINHLTANGITSLSGIVALGGLDQLGGLPVAADDPAVVALNAHANLSILSSNLALNAKLVEAGLTDVSAIAAMTRAEFVSQFHAEVGDLVAARLHAEAVAISRMLDNVTIGLAAESANGFDGVLSQLGVPLKRFFQPKCACRDCESALSAVAYLADLLDYATRHLRIETGGQRVPVTLEFLSEAFHQRFGDLEVSCGQPHEHVLQVRICIEVLRSFLQAAPPTTEKKDALVRAESAYRLAAYDAILSRIGTSLNELRLARSPEDARERLAARLGITLAQLEALPLREEDVTELMLERFFGLPDTTRDPLSERAKLDDDLAQLLRWKLDRVEWNRHTDADGVLHVRLTNPGSAFRVELFRDPARTERVAAGEGTTPKGRVGVAADDVSDFSGRFDLNFTAASDEIEIVAVPHFLSWRLQALRRLWLQQDRPVDPYSDDADPRLPVIDPDIISADDLRSPATGSAAFDLWLKRREWVDDRLSEHTGVTKPVVDAAGASIDVPDIAAILDRMYQPVFYGTVDAIPWAATTPPSVFDALHDNLVHGVDLSPTAARLRADLRLDVQEFTQLVATGDKAQRFEGDPRNPPVRDDEWRDVFSILAQAQKRAFHVAWIAEEESASVKLEPQHFWISLKEPRPGDWPPTQGANTPLVDPERVERTDLAEPTVGQKAIDRLAARRVELQAIREDLHEAHAASGFDALLRLAVGHPDPGDPLQHDLTVLRTNLNSSDPALVAEARGKIENDLHTTVDAFVRLTNVIARPTPTAGELADVFDILTSARKEKQEFARWKSEEDTAGFVYWNTLKARLPRWRAGADSRGEWQQALLTRSRQPLIDPDLVGPADFQYLEAGDTAFELWQARRTQVDALLDLVSQDRESIGVEATIDKVVGQDTLTALQTLKTDLEKGHDIGAGLAQIGLPFAAFVRLLELASLAASLQPEEKLLDSEARDIDSILVQWQKEREYPSWRDEEEQLALTLGPDHFRLAFEELETLPLWRATRRQRREWRDRLAARIEQEESFQTAIETAVYEAEKSTLPGLRDALVLASDAPGNPLSAKADWITRNLLIDARMDACQKTTRVAQASETIQQLLYAIRTGQEFDLHPTLQLDADHFDDEWEWLGAYATWRAAMQVFLYPENVLYPSLRSRQTPAFRELLEQTRNRPRLTPEQACCLAEHYAQYFRDVCSMQVEASCQARTLIHQGESCCNQAATEYRFLTYYFGRGTETSRVYWSSFDAREACRDPQTHWTAVPGLIDVDVVIGASAYSVTEEERYICLFVRVLEQGDQKLKLTRYDLETQKWDDQPLELEVPEESKNASARFQAVIAQTLSPLVTPHLAIRGRSGAIYDRPLNRDATGWRDEAGHDDREMDGDWHVLVARSKGREFDRLWGMVRQNDGDFYLFAQTPEGYLRYRLFGKNADGYWRPRRTRPETPSNSSNVGTSLTLGHPDLDVAVLADFAPQGEGVRVEAWRGEPIGLFLSGLQTVYVYWKSERQPVLTPTAVPFNPNNPSVFGELKTKRVYQSVTSGTAAGSEGIDKLETFNGWLEEVTGVSLKGRTVQFATFVTSVSVFRLLTIPLDELNELFKPLLAFVGVYKSHVAETLDAIEANIRDDEGWKEWRYADMLVRRLSDGRSLPNVLRILFKNRFASNKTTIRFANRLDAFSAEFGAQSGLRRVVPTVNTVFPSGATIAAGYESGQVGEYRVRLAPKANENPSRLFEEQRDPLRPKVTAPLDIPDRLRPEDKLIRRQLIKQAFLENEDGPPSHLDYLEEAYYFVPVQLGLQLQQRGQYLAALDWFRTVYDYGAPAAERKIYQGLIREEQLSETLKRAADWLADPLDPHALGATRANTYTRFTVLSIVRCLLAFADTEFGRDTVESVARARALYGAAVELLHSEGLTSSLQACHHVIEELHAEVSPRIASSAREWSPVWNGLRLTLGQIGDIERLEQTAVDVRAALTAPDLGAGLVAALAVVVKAVEPDGSSTTSEVVTSASRRNGKLHSLLIGASGVTLDLEIIPCQGELVQEAVAAAVGTTPEGLGGFDLTWLREPVTTSPAVALATPPTNTRLVPISSFNPIAPSHVSLLADAFRAAPMDAMKRALGTEPGFSPGLYSALCVPPNPILSSLRAHAELNLFKIRTCRNIAGDERVLEPYQTASQVASGLAGFGGQLLIPGSILFLPTPFRYPVLVERAKQLAGHAQQIEAAFLSTLEKLDAEYMNLLKARQDVRLAREGIRLQDLRVKEAEDGVTFAELQRERAEIQGDHFQSLLSEGLLPLEQAAVAYMVGAAFAFGKESTIKTIVTLGLGGGAEAGQVLSTLASILQLFASHERQKQEWALQRDLAAQDVRIGTQQVRLAQDHVRIVGQERNIAEVQSEHADEVAEFLANKFTNADLYEWMSGVLEGVYSFFLQHATAAARLAENQLAFERQQIMPALIQADYWEAPLGMEAGVDTNGTPPDRRGMTGSTRLLRDITKLDEFAFASDRRKLQLTKTVSLARMAPVEFQRFRESGVILFNTPMRLFDQDFPGHYLRLITRVRTSVIALIPPTDGIKATLRTIGISRVVIDAGGTFQTVEPRRPPESVALSSPREATGLFELVPQSQEKLFPFESMGVDTSWELQMPKAANFFDYTSIADVLMTIEYTALNSVDYRKQVIEALDRSIKADRPFSFRHELADQWYDLHHPESDTATLTVEFDTRSEDFPPNLDAVRIQHVALFVSRADGIEREVTANLSFVRNVGNAPTTIEGNAATTIDGLVSTRHGQANAWSNFNGHAPFGRWKLSLDNDLHQGVRLVDAFKNEQISDMLFVLTYSGDTPGWPG